MEEVTITVAPDGTVKVGVRCVKGKSCKDLTKDLEKALGRTVKDVPTPEMTEATHVHHRR